MSPAQPTGLSWAKTKDALILGIGTALVALLGFLLKGQSESNLSLAEVKRDLAVYATEAKRDRQDNAEFKNTIMVDINDHEDRIRNLEAKVRVPGVPRG